ncbi:hypothetical protein WH47_02089 [Habropoda laboriosa]|uniref:Uncharacterized protein n=1 Tax=Habropoda laboriosa TaxID=597456 RepID=A0A0L7RJ36_9HYME|nr:hypothetical protein WH47_02089 [Habropoda laboriosa]
MEFGGYKGTGPRVRVRRRAELGRRLTRRLSLVAKMPAAILSKANPPEPKPVEITAIAPDKTSVSKLRIRNRMSIDSPRSMVFDICFYWSHACVESLQTSISARSKQLILV